MYVFNGREFKWDKEQSALIMTINENSKFYMINGFILCHEDFELMGSSPKKPVDDFLIESPITGITNHFTFHSHKHKDRWVYNSFLKNGLIAIIETPYGIREL